MDKYEYKTFVFDTKGVFGGIVDTSQFENALNVLGNDGWELVGSFSTAQAQGASKSIVCILKRRK